MSEAESTVLAGPLDAGQFAVVAGCDRSTVYNRVASGRVSPSDVILQNGREVYGFAHADAQREKEQRECNKGKGIFQLPQGRAYTVRKAARVIKLPSSFLRRCMRNTSLLPEGKLPVVKWPPDAREHAKPRGQPPKGRQRTEEDNGLTLILAKDLVRLRAAVRKALRDGKTLDREKWKRAGELVKHLDLKRTVDVFELGESLVCWKEKKLVQHNTALLRVPGQRGLHLREMTFYNVSQVEARWQADYLKTGNAAFRKLFDDGRKQVPLTKVEEELAALGIVGVRLRRVAKKAGARRRRPTLAREAVYELLSPEQKITVTKAIEGLRVNGPPLAKVANDTLRAFGYSRKSILKALKALKIKSRQASYQGPYYWCGPGEHPPAATGPQGIKQKATVQVLAEAGKPLSAGEVAKALRETRKDAYLRLWRLARAGLIQSVERGRFEPAAPKSGQSEARQGVCVPLPGTCDKYPGHTKKPYRTGRQPNETREGVIEWLYDQYFGLGRRPGEILKAGPKHFGHAGERYLPRTKDQLRSFAKEWAGRWEPRLPLKRGWARDRRAHQDGGGNGGGGNGGGGNSQAAAPV
jgi:hypothetical protein